MTTYYPGPGILITHEVVRILVPEPRTLPISELRRPYITRGTAYLPVGTWWRPRVRCYELHAIHRGQVVTLFACPDRRVFGQVTRALVRAVEAYRDSVAHAVVNGT